MGRSNTIRLNPPATVFTFCTGGTLTLRETKQGCSILVCMGRTGLEDLVLDCRLDQHRPFYGDAVCSIHPVN